MTLPNRGFGPSQGIVDAVARADIAALEAGPPASYTLAAVLANGNTPALAGDDLGSLALPFDLFARHICVPEGSAPSLGADRGYIFMATGTPDLQLAGETPSGGVRIVYPTAPTTQYLRLSHDGSNAVYERVGAGRHYFANGVQIDSSGGLLVSGSGYVETPWLLMPESTTPGSVANQARCYAPDESGTTALRAAFPTNDVRWAKDIAPVAITQTYSTTTATHAAMTSADLAAFSGGMVGFADAAERDGIRTELNALRADVINVKGVLNALIDAIQAQTTYVS